MAWLQELKQQDAELKKLRAQADAAAAKAKADAEKAEEYRKRIAELQQQVESSAGTHQNDLQLGNYVNYSKSWSEVGYSYPGAQ